MISPPSFPSLGGRFRGLILRGDRARIAALCERLFNIPAAGAVEYQPLGRYVLLLVGSFAEISSTAVAFRHWGSTSEAMASFWVPLAAGRREGKKFVTERLCMAVPYIFVDNPMSFAGGREIYGYPKCMGRFSPTNAVGEHVLVETFGGNFHPDNQASWHPILEIARAGAALRSEGDPAIDPDLPPVSTDGRSQLKFGREVALLTKLIDGLLHKRVRQVFLKQFRDVADETRACYQAVIEAPVQATRADWRMSLREWQVTIHALDSHPIGQELGVLSQETRLSYELEMDMIVEPGAVVGPAMVGDDAALDTRGQGSGDRGQVGARTSP